MGVEKFGGISSCDTKASEKWRDVIGTAIRARRYTYLGPWGGKVGFLNRIDWERDLREETMRPAREARFVAGFCRLQLGNEGGKIQRGPGYMGGAMMGVQASEAVAIKRPRGNGKLRE